MQEVGDALCRDTGPPGRVGAVDPRPRRAVDRVALARQAEIVSERLGHAKVSITLDLYSHVLPDMQGMATGAINQLFPSMSDASS
jgi:hypothetical protein